MPPRQSPLIYQLKITLEYIRPPIWRRVQVPANIRLCCLHDVFQIVMGWTGGHLHQFEKDDECWGVPDYDEPGSYRLNDEARATLQQLLTYKGDTLRYTYDFGDDWRHKVVLEKILPALGTTAKPVCLGGARRCPPEDVGGPPGYQDFLEVIFDPKHEDHEHMKSWAGGWFQPEEFDLNAVNEALSRMRWPARHPARR